MATFTYLSIFKTKWIIWTVSQEVSHGLNLLPKAFQEKCHRPFIASQFPKPLQYPSPGLSSLHTFLPFLNCSIYLPWTDIPTFHHPLASLWMHQTSNSTTFSVPNKMAKRTALHLILENWAMFRFSRQRFQSPLYKLLFSFAFFIFQNHKPIFVEVNTWP